MPLYWAITSFKVAVLLLGPAVVLHAKLDWAYIAKSYLFIPAPSAGGEIAPLLGVGWTLNFEMFFYALFALALLLRLRPTLFIAPILVLLAGLSTVKTEAWPVPLFFWANPIVLDFLAGMLVAHWCRAGRTLPAGLALLFVAAGLVYLFVPFQRPADDLVRSLATTMASALVVIGAIGLERETGDRVPRFVLFLGAASYSLYLIHPVIAPAAPQVLVRLGLHAPALAILASMAIATVAAALCYVLLEQPATRLVTAWAKRHNLLTPERGGRQRQAPPHSTAELASGDAGAHAPVAIKGLEG